MEARVITVSREALRADLLALELRLTKIIAEGLSRKADTTYVASIDHRVAEMERDAIRRDGPIMRGLQADIDAHSAELATRAQLIPEFRRLQADFADLEKIVKSDDELRTLVREEAGARSTTQWTTFNRVAAVLLLLCTLVSLFLAYRASTAAQPAGPQEESARVGIVESA